MYPRLVVDLKKLRSNLDACAKIVKEDGGCSLMIVTKGLCADPEMARMLRQLLGKKKDGDEKNTD